MWIIRRASTYLLLAGALVLSAGSGYLTSQALGLGLQAPTKTVTVNVGTGAQGPQGPPGPKGEPGPPGPAGAETCPAGSSFGKLVINHPGGQTAILTCIVG